MDLIRQLGVLAFGSRLRRLNERLSKDVSRIYRDQGIGFEVRWFPVFYLLTLDRGSVLRSAGSRFFIF